MDRPCYSNVHSEGACGGIRDRSQTAGLTSYFLSLFKTLHVCIALSLNLSEEQKIHTSSPFWKTIFVGNAGPRSLLHSPRDESRRIRTLSHHGKLSYPLIDNGLPLPLPSPQDRMWRKNRRPAECHNKEWHTVCCRGVDLNRNFDWYWAGTVSTVSPRLPYSTVVVRVPYPCSPAASVSFSLRFLFWFVPRYVPRTGCILRARIGCCERLPRGVPTEGKRPQFITLEHSNNIINITLQAFISLHSYSQMWLIPFGHRRRSYPNDYSSALVSYNSDHSSVFHSDDIRDFQ